MSLVVGVGLRAGTPPDELRDLVQQALPDYGDVRIVVTMKGREAEVAVRQLVRDLGAELITVAPEELAEQQVPTPSDQVERLAGIPSVAEAAVLSTGAQLIVPKRRSANATAAIGTLQNR